ncbi:MAG: glycosyltransferase family 4 protein [bacterium]
MKIAYIALKGMTFGGGIEKWTEEVGSRLAKKGHEIIVYTMRHYDEAKDRLYKGMKIKTVPTLRSKSLEKITATFIATLKCCLEKDIDIVHFHAFGPAMFCFIPRIHGRKVVVQEHGLEWKRAKWGIVGRLFLRVTEIPSVIFPNVVVVVSEVQKRYLMERYGRESIYIPEGVNLPQIEKPDLIKQYGLYGNDYILFVARPVREKGAHYLIEAYKRLRPNLKLVIAGDARYEEAYKSRLYKMAQGNKNIIFTGFVRGKMLHELLSNCYLFVHPSEIEGLAIILLEAMSYGNCCLVSNIPENLEALNNFGYTFRNKDVSDLAEKLAFLINNRQAVESVKERAKNHVIENYSWDKISSDFESLYKEVIGNR